MSRNPDVAGDRLLLRHAVGDRTWCLLPVTVLRGGEPLALRISAGSTWFAAENGDGRRLRIGARHWRLGRRQWVGHDVTYLFSAGRWYATGLMTEAATGAPVKWYVNFQTPYRSRPWGVDTLDLELDLQGPYDPVASPLRTKDVTRFVVLAGTGRLPPGALRGIASDAVAARREMRSATGQAALLRAAAVRCSVPDLDALLRNGPVPPDLPQLVQDV